MPFFDTLGDVVSPASGPPLTCRSRPGLQAAAWLLLLLLGVFDAAAQIPVAPTDRSPVTAPALVPVVPPAGSPDRTDPGEWSSVYRLGPRDRIMVQVFDEPNLSGQFVVDGQGAIMYPLLRTVPAAGLTAVELADSLTRRLAAGYLRRPQVTVTLEAARSRQVFVVGAVRSPGAYMLDGPVRLLEVLALAGSATRDAYGEVVLSRREAVGLSDPQSFEGALPVHAPRRVLNLEAIQAGRQGSEVVLRDGDLVYVRPAGRVFVRGEVANPGEYPLRLGMTVRQLIASAGGFTPYAARGRISVEREFPVAAGGTRRLDADLDMVIREDDTVHVATRWF